MNHPLYIIWTENNNTGIPIIDEQHRGIISTINSLHYFMQTGHGEEIIKPTLITLEQYIAIHFKTEEALLEAANYPALEEHMALHRAWDEKAHLLSTHTDSSELLKFLKEWWMGHIRIEDKNYVPFLR